MKNKRIKELVEQAGFYMTEKNGQSLAEFAELIVQECVNECRQVWYDLNNEQRPVDETPREIAIRIGQKNGSLQCIHRIKEHFGVEE